MRVLIVDDEPLARARLSRLLRGSDDVRVVGEAGDGQEALALAARLAPDAILIDLQMPGMDGFGVVARLPRPRPAIVFVTAHEQHAAQAFDTDAVDYLLKPVHDERLARAVERLRAELASLPARPRPTSPLLITDKGATTVWSRDEVEWLESADNYVHVQLRVRSFLMRRTLAGLVDELGSGFVRVHRGFAVPLRGVAAVRARGKGDATVLLRCGKEVPCSRPYREALMQRLRVA